MYLTLNSDTLISLLQSFDAINFDNEQYLIISVLII